MGVAVRYGLTAGHVLFPAAVVSAPGRLVLLMILVTLGLVLYAAALRALGVARLKDLNPLRRGARAWHGSPPAKEDER